MASVPLNTILPQGLNAIAGSGYNIASQNPEDLGRGINIRVVPAHGGTIITIRDENTYSASSELHVVHSDADIGAELSKIITMHLLKKE